MNNKKEAITKEGLKEIIEKSGIKPEKKHKILIDVRDRIEKEKTMELSIKEGSAASVMSGFGDNYISPYALALNSSASQIYSHQTKQARNGNLVTK